MDVSIIIVNWNTKDLLCNCLKSVDEQAGDIDYEIIVVDNNSSDDSVKMVTDGFKHVILIENSENVGFAAANNQAIQIAKGRYVLLLNSDTEVLDKAIEKTVVFADKHPKAGAVGCRVLNPDGTLQNTCFMFPSVLNMLISTFYFNKLFPSNRFFGREQMTWWDRNDVRDVDVITGCYMLVRKDAIERIGNMDENYFVYGEETDWCYRLKKDGWEIMFTPASQIIHYGGQGTKQQRAEMILQLRGSILLFIKKHKSNLSHIFSCLLTSFFFFLRAPYWFAVSITGKRHRNESLLIAAAYLSGGIRSLVNWKKLLINKIAVKERTSCG